MAAGDTDIIKVPLELKSPICVPNKTLCGPGPTNMHPRVAAALNLPLLGHLHKEFTYIMDDIQKGIRYVFQTTNGVAFALSGTGHAGMECCLMNLVESGDTVAVVKSGIWGERCGEMVDRLGGFTNFIEANDVGCGVQMEAVEKCLVQVKPSVLYVAQGESSTGVLEDIEAIASVCRSHNCLTIVDTVASLGGVPFKMDDWNVDCVFTGSQKVLGKLIVVVVVVGLTTLLFARQY